MQEGTNERDDLRELRDRIHQLADEARVQIHLASMEGRELWEKLQPRLDELDRRFDKATRDLNLREEMRKIERQLRKVVEDITE